MKNVIIHNWLKILIIQPLFCVGLIYLLLILTGDFLNIEIQHPEYYKLVFGEPFLSVTAGDVVLFVIVAFITSLLAVLLFNNSTLRFRIISIIFTIVVVGLIVYPNLVVYRCKRII
jgi:hypothetical protein